jgi:hypothetical protein
MTKRIITLLSAMLLALAMMAVPAMAADELGTPGEENCKGQTAAYMAQTGGMEIYGAPLPGIGNLARHLDDVLDEDVSVRDVHAAFDEFCAA